MIQKQPYDSWKLKNEWNERVLCTILIDQTVWQAPPASNLSFLTGSQLRRDFLILEVLEMKKSPDGQTQTDKKTDR